MIAKLLRLKNVAILGGALFVAWIGWGTYTYFFDISIPKVELSGLNELDFYAGDMQCGVTSTKKETFLLGLMGSRF